MCKPIKCLYKTTIRRLEFVLLAIAIQFVCSVPAIEANASIGTATVTTSANIASGVSGIGSTSTLFTEQEKVENLVRDWAPLVWLAPGEKFMPGDVTEFLPHVHAEKAKFKLNMDDQTATAADELMHQYYYDTDNEFSTILSQISSRHKRTFKERNHLLRYIIDLPVGQHSNNWFLVTNDEIDDLLVDTSSFIYGQSPLNGNVPIYAMVTMCGATEFRNQPIGADIDDYMNAVEPRAEIRRSTYIPVTKNYTFQNDRVIVNKSSNMDNRNQAYETNKLLDRTKRNADAKISDAEPTGAVEGKSLNNNVNTLNLIRDDKFGKSTLADINQTESDRTKYPHFHVTYWMFYPYNQGKTMCTLSLGPFGHLPIPQILGVCLGTRKDFGSHVGDWEHMTLFFKGNREPDEMYVSAHDAGAYYEYERLTGTFDFRRQETREGILQHPNFPKTVVTSNNHPVLFSAEGSHGLWTAPGKHRFVRVPRLFDVNGFGTPWYTWKQVEIAYESERNGRTIGPPWLRFNGRWGNPKSKCHPLKKVGLNFCEYFDGPTGIPVKTPHFQCPK